MKGKLFNLGDWVYLDGKMQRERLRGQATGEFRPPRKGEWYISGAIPVAYQAPNDLNRSYYIATIVEVRVEQVVHVVREVQDQRAS